MKPKFSGSTLRDIFKMRLLPVLFQCSGKKLGRPQRDLPGLETIRCAEAVRLQVPELTAFGRDCIMPGVTLDYAPAEVHRVDAGVLKGKARVLSGGAVYIQDKYLLSCGTHPSAAILSTRAPASGSTRTERVVLLPWAHPWFTFGDFMMMILPYTCRILSVLSAKERRDCVIALPRLGQKPYVSNFLGLLGVAREQVVDLDAFDLQPAADGVIYTANSNPFHFHSPHPHDWERVRKLFAEVEPVGNGPAKLYFGRSGQRRYKDEARLCAGLRERGYEILKDISLPSREQVALFRGKKSVVAPHGASLGNLIFSDAYDLLELQHPSWVQPYFRYCAAARGQGYRLVLPESGRLRKKPIYAARLSDIDIPAETVLSALDSQT